MGRFARLLILLIATGFLAFSGEAVQAGTATLEGQALDYNNRPVPGGQVQLVSRMHYYTTTADAQGRFKFQVPADFYSLRMSTADSLFYQRAPMALGRGRTVFVTVRPVFRPSQPANAPLLPDPKIHYRSFPVQGPSQLGAVLRTTEHPEGEPLSFFSQDYPMLSYDTLAVYAPEIEMNRFTNVCTATGGVVIELGTDLAPRHATRAVIDLNHRRISIDGRESFSF